MNRAYSPTPADFDIDLAKDNRCLTSGVRFSSEGPRRSAGRIEVPRIARTCLRCPSHKSQRVANASDSAGTNPCLWIRGSSATDELSTCWSRGFEGSPVVPLLHSLPFPDEDPRRTRTNGPQRPPRPGAGGPEEEIDEQSVRDRYLVGMLAPKAAGTLTRAVRRAFPGGQRIGRGRGHGIVVPDNEDDVPVVVRDDVLRRP